MSKEIESILITKDQLKARVKAIAQSISKDFKGEEVALIGVLKGAFVFLADLVREIEVPVRLGFIKVSSYGNKKVSSGRPRITKDLDNFSIKGKNIVIVEDIVDTGRTLKIVVDHFKALKPKTLKTCVLLDKKERRTKKVQLDYIGFEVPNKFVVGYGLDFADRHRNLPYVGILKD